MKKILMVAAAAMVSLSMSAQVYVGGSLGMTTSKLDMGHDNDASGTSFTIAPEVGYNLNSEWAVGISVTYSNGLASMGNISANDLRGLLSTALSASADLANGDDFDSSLSGFTVAPYARYTYLGSGILELFVDGMCGYSSMKADKGDDPKLNVFEVCARPGFAVRLGENFRLLGKLGYVGFQSLKVKDASYKGIDEPSLTRAGVNLSGNNITLGVTYTF